MARSSHESRRPLRWQMVLFPILMGTVAWASLREANPTISTIPSSPAVEAQSTSTQILLARSAPGKDRDEAFVYDDKTNTVTPTSTAPGWRIPKTSFGRIAARNEMGIWAFEAPHWESVTLRTSRGNPYNDPMLIGSLDANHAVILAINSDRAVLLMVSRNGSIRELATLPEESRPISVQEGRIWIVASPLQEGIETPPHGPSAIWSIDGYGATSTTIMDERDDTVISNLLTRGSDVVFQSEKGDMRVMMNNGLSTPVPGKPLVWLPDHRLIFVQNQRLCSLTTERITPTCMTDVPPSLTWAQLLTL